MEIGCSDLGLQLKTSWSTNFIYLFLSETIYRKLYIHVYIHTYIYLEMLSEWRKIALLPLCTKPCLKVEPAHSMVTAHQELNLHAQGTEAKHLPHPCLWCGKSELVYAMVAKPFELGEPGERAVT